MKTLIKCLILLSFISYYSCASDDDGATELMPVADFSFSNDGSTFSFTNLSQNATSYRWDFGDLKFYGDEENPVYTYDIGGELTVSLTAINENGQEDFISKTIQAPEIIIIDIKIDGGFDDWNDVDYAYESPDPTKGSMQKMKVWARGEKINVYLEGNTTMNMAIVDMFINSDGDASSGFLHSNWPASSGADFLFEGPFVSNGWGAFYQHIDPNGGWGWAAIPGSGSNLTVSDLIVIDANTHALEFSMPKSQFGSVGDSIGLAFTELTEGWSAVANFPDDDSFVVIEL
ncbi:PKD domain-containing protein [Salegentibacter sp. HM20]